MDSESLRQFGFNEWYPVCQIVRLVRNREEALRSGIYSGYCVYAFRTERFGRLNGSSDIVYIGSTENLLRRFQSFVNGGGVAADRRINNAADRRINTYLFKKGNANKADVGWARRANAVQIDRLEKQLLMKCEEEHYELPPLNSIIGNISGIPSLEEKN